MFTRVILVLCTMATLCSCAGNPPIYDHVATNHMVSYCYNRDKLKMSDLTSSAEKVCRKYNRHAQLTNVTHHCATATEVDDFGYYDRATFKCVK